MTDQIDGSFNEPTIIETFGNSSGDAPQPSRTAQLCPICRSFLVPAAHAVRAKKSAGKTGAFKLR
jgi:hypothetical protein